MKLINPGNIHDWPNPADPLQRLGNVWYFLNHESAERFMAQAYPNRSIQGETARRYMKEVESSSLPNQDGYAWLPLLYRKENANLRLQYRVWGTVANDANAALEFNLKMQAKTSLEAAEPWEIARALSHVHCTRLRDLDQQFGK